jgi:anaerobic selenocysteine-containing dehydrogenase
MYVSGVNPVVTYPNTQKTVAALRSLDFLVVASDMMTPTAELADIVLPTTTGIEEEDVKLAHTASAITYTYPAVPPRGEARSDLDIAIALLDRMQARNAVTKNLFRWRTQREFVDYLLGDSKITVDMLRERGFVEFPSNFGNFEERPFRTKTGKAELYSEQLAALGLDPLPNFVAQRARPGPRESGERFPLILLTGDREKTYHHSRFREQDWAKKVSPHPLLLVHPETARVHSLSHNEWARLETENGPGSCRLKIKVTEATPEGVVSTGMGWWKPESATPDRGAFDININAAMTYDGPWDPMSGSADTRGIRCRVVPAVDIA